MSITQNEASLNYEIAINLHHMILRGGSGMNLFRKKNLFNRFHELKNAVIDKIKKYIIDHSYDSGSYRILSLNPLVDMAYKHGIIDVDDLGFYHTLYKFDDFFLDKSKYIVYRDLTGSVAISTYSNIEECVQAYQINIKNIDPHYIYTEGVCGLLSLEMLESHLKDNIDEIRSLYKKLKECE